MTETLQAFPLSFNNNLRSPQPQELVIKKW
jgi:hypothetical protein